MGKVHDFDAAWKTILEAFEIEIVEILFPELNGKIAWELGSESLDNELQDIQKEIFDKYTSNKIISDKIIKVKTKYKENKILFIHVEVQSYESKNNAFGERMFRYFYRIWDRFRYKYNDDSEIIAAAIYTYKGNYGKDKRYIYEIPELKRKILLYNFRTIDVEEINIAQISANNPLKLVFKMAKKLLELGSDDKKIYDAKIALAKELSMYSKIENKEQIKALVDFLEYLFLINNKELENKYNEFKKISGGVVNMSIDEIRKIHYTEEGRKEGKEEGVILSKREDILDNLAELGEVPKTILDIVNKQKDIDILKRWIRLAVKSSSIEEFKENMA